MCAVTTSVLLRLFNSTTVSHSIEIVQGAGTVDSRGRVLCWDEFDVQPIRVVPPKLVPIFLISCMSMMAQNLTAIWPLEVDERVRGGEDSGGGGKSRPAEKCRPGGRVGAPVGLIFL